MAVTPSATVENLNPRPYLDAILATTLANIREAAKTAPTTHYYPPEASVEERHYACIGKRVGCGGGVVDDDGWWDDGGGRDACECGGWCDSYSRHLSKRDEDSEGERYGGENTSEGSGADDGDSCDAGVGGDADSDGDGGDGDSDGESDGDGNGNRDLGSSGAVGGGGGGGGGDVSAAATAGGSAPHSGRTLIVFAVDTAAGSSTNNTHHHSTNPPLPTPFFTHCTQRDHPRNRRVLLRQPSVRDFPPPRSRETSEKYYPTFNLVV
eukprot:TRINITY_DN5765_c0_g1_i1.p1 TRINITY_DN5765_c0_g1~~TRINITY_DN5765_c0_g1_i1.p1  ORF type:complete len:266 (-),score=66.84 TRINITY_DN5765_c0_g1_i1:56-853(-)